MHMNEQQHAAADAPNGYLQIIAGPGTGKTVTMVGRIVTLISRGIDPRRIVAMTFTRAAAFELRSRIYKELQHKANGVIIGTFHSVSILFLRKYGEFQRLGIRILGDHDALSICREIDPAIPARSLFLLFKKLQNLTLDEQIELCDKSLLPNGIELYNKFKERQRALSFYDFDELLKVFVGFLRTSRHFSVDRDVDAVLIDEFQDTCSTQLEIALLMASKSGNLTVVGDPKQSIYAFRGAVPQVFAKMREGSPVTVQQMPLKVSYRSTQPILTTAQRVLKSDLSKKVSSNLDCAITSATRAFEVPRDKVSVIDSDLKSIVAKNTEIPVEIVQLTDSRNEAWTVARQIQKFIDIGVKPRDVCVLSATSTNFVQFESAFMSFGIKYQLVGGKQLLNTGSVTKFIDYIRVALNGSDSLAISRTINQPSRRIGPKALEKIEKTCSDRLGLSFTKLKTSDVPGVSDYVAEIDIIRALLNKREPTGITQTKEYFRETVEHLRTKLFPETNTELLLSAIDVFDSEFSALSIDENLTFAQYFVSIWALNPANSEVENDTDQDNQVICSTIHSAKGLEWPIVFVLGAYRPNVYAKDDYGEIQRLLFVAMTRAKRYLAIVLGSDEDGAILNLDPVHKMARKFSSIDSATIKCLESCLDYRLDPSKLKPSMIGHFGDNKIDNSLGRSLGFSTGLDLKWSEQNIENFEHKPAIDKKLAPNDTPPPRAPAKRLRSPGSIKQTKPARKNQPTLKSFFK